jgi:large subunit ribosomal protein L23
MDPHIVLRRPIITEKSTMLGEAGQYVFEVAREANKIEVKRAVEAVFKVKVRAVNIIHVPSKTRRMGRSVGLTRAWKKAVVSLQEGHRIEFFQAV